NGFIGGTAGGGEVMATGEDVAAVGGKRHCIKCRLRAFETPQFGTRLEVPQPNVEVIRSRNHTMPDLIATPGDGITAVGRYGDAGDEVLVPFENVDLADLLGHVLLYPLDPRQHRLAACQRRLVDVQLQPRGRPLQLQFVDAGAQRKRDLLVRLRVDDADQFAALFDDHLDIVPLGRDDQFALVGLDPIHNPAG